MGRCALYTTKFWWAMLLSGGALCTAGGCWEEIEYRAPTSANVTQTPATATAARPQESEQPAPSPQAADVVTPSVEAEAAGFGADLAESLPTPSEATPEARSAAPGPEIDRYSMPPAETSANYASSDSYVEDGFAAADGTLAAATGDPVSGEPAREPPNTALAAWQLGSKLSLAALAYDRGVAADRVGQWLAESKLLANSLGTAIADLPEVAVAEGGQGASEAVLSYLLSQGQRAGRDLARQHGRRHPALLEVAMKSNLLRVTYEPNSTATEKLSASIAIAAERAELPEPLWRPLLASISAAAEIEEVRAAVKQLHSDAERYLAQQGGR